MGRRNKYQQTSQSLRSISSDFLVFGDLRGKVSLRMQRRVPCAYYRLRTASSKVGKRQITSQHPLAPKTFNNRQMALVCLLINNPTRLHRLSLHAA